MTLTLTGLPQLVHFTFILTCFGMVGGALFFGLLSTKARGTWATVLAIECVICTIAALNYVYMRQIYAGLGGGIGGAGQRFPTEFRYIDWTLTVPLIVAQFPVLLGLGRRGLPFMITLIASAYAMLITGFFGEISSNTAVHWGLFGVSDVFWFVIIGMLWYGIKELPEGVDEGKRGVVRRLALFVLVGWCIYPIGYMLPSLGIPGDWRELAYNIADLVNKVGSGISCAAAAIAVINMRDAGDDEYYASEYEAEDEELRVPELV